MLRKRYSFTTNYREFYEITDADAFIKKVDDSDKKLVMMCAFSVIKIFDTANKVIETGETTEEKIVFDIVPLKNTYELLESYFKKNMDEQEFKALEQECLLEYAERCMEVISDLENISNKNN